MKFKYDEKELEVFDAGDVGLFNYCKTLAGHTLMIENGFKLVPTIIPNTFTIERDLSVFIHDANCEGSMCWCNSRYKKKLNSESSIIQTSKKQQDASSCSGEVHIFN